MKADIYNQTGEKTGSIDLPETVFGLPYNPKLIHQVFYSMQSNKREVIAHSKGRGAVRGGGAKPWAQKGTGRARHGSRRSPIWVGGGVTFGPTNERNFSKKINKKMNKKAFFTALSQKLRDNEVLFLDKVTLADAKTKGASEILKNISKIEGFEKLSTKKKNALALALSKGNDKTRRSFQNIPGVVIGEAKNLSLLDLLTYKYLILTDPKEGVKILQSRV